MSIHWLHEECFVVPSSEVHSSHIHSNHKIFNYNSSKNLKKKKKNNIIINMTLTTINMQATWTSGGSLALTRLYHLSFAIQPSETTHSDQLTIPLWPASSVVLSSYFHRHHGFWQCSDSLGGDRPSNEGPPLVVPSAHLSTPEMSSILVNLKFIPFSRQLEKYL